MAHIPSISIDVTTTSGMCTFSPVAFTINANTTDKNGALSAFFHAVPRSPCNSITPSDHIASSVPTLNTNNTATAFSPNSDSLNGMGTKPKLNTPIVMA